MDSTAYNKSYNPNNYATEVERSFEEMREEVLNDYRLAWESRHASLLGRKEVLTGKAKFGIFGDGKEVAQVAMAKAFEVGDIRSGYYRDQTFMFATGMSDVQKFFAQLYAHVDVVAEPSSAGRSMNGHFGSRFLNDDGTWKDLTAAPQSSSDISPTGGQMGRALGLAFASKLYRENPELTPEVAKGFSNNGNEVVFATIGNASTSEGHFWETVNAAGVLSVPLAISIWDDEYGISVPARYQTTKQNLSELLSGFNVDESGQGFLLYRCEGWNYPALCEMYLRGIAEVRERHLPAIFHIVEMTQPQGHSTSGSHERYKSKDRLEWEQANDCLQGMRRFLLSEGLADEDTLNAIEAEAKKMAETARKAAWTAFRNEIDAERTAAIEAMEELMSTLGQHAAAEKVKSLIDGLRSAIDPGRKEVLETVRRALLASREAHTTPAFSDLKAWLDGEVKLNAERYSNELYATGEGSLLGVKAVAAKYPNEPTMVNGYELLNKFFDHTLTHNPRFFALGEDVGKIGDVNQGFMGMQDKHGEHRVTDTGIREMTIVGQGYGAAMRGLRPLVEIQYLDYLLYALQLMSDDIATLRWRTKAGQQAPLIIRTRGHRLEGIWHSGSPMGMIINAVRGMHVLVPRNTTQAVGFYNALLQSNEPGLVIECLNGYRLKEALPENLNEFTLRPGEPEVIRQGTDVTLVTYGSSCRLAVEAGKILAELGVEIEVVDVQSLLPFDVNHSIVESLKKTNRILFFDEDVPGGATAFMYQQVIEEQGGFRWLDQPAKTLTAKAHRPAYGSDGDYFSKPSIDDIVETIYGMVAEDDPANFPKY